MSNVTFLHSSYHGNTQVPLGIEVHEFRCPMKGETYVSTYDGEFQKIVEATYTFSGKAFICTDHRPEIERIYGKPADQLTAPEGYEFTGEFRVAKQGETVVNDYCVAYPFTYTNCGGSKAELILRKIEEKEVETVVYSDGCSATGVKPLPKYSPAQQLALPLAGYTADNIIARYGQNVLDVFGYREGTLRDYPGFVYSGELTNVNPGEWYVYAGQVRKYENLNKSVFSSLTLIPTTPPEPRIVQFTLTAPEDFEPGEAQYIRDDQGGFMTAMDAPEGAALYSRSEVE